MSFFKRSKYQSVDASTTVKDEYVIENGKTLEINEAGVNAAQSNDVMVCICFDGTALIATHGDAIQRDITCIGDGVKKLEIMLKNNSGVAETIGGYYQGDLLDS